MGFFVEISLGIVTAILVFGSDKTSHRDIICRSGTINYIKRIHESSEDITYLELEELLKRRFHPSKAGVGIAGLRPILGV